MQNHLNNLLLDLCNISIEAGHKIMEFYDKEFDITIKKDSSPLTKADLAANRLINHNLSSINKNIPILSEESLVDWNKRKTWTKYWLVDPLDGTKEFIKKNGEFTVNIALIENNKPVIGIIYLPAKSLLYYAKQNNGSFRINTIDRLESLHQAQNIKVKKNPEGDKVRIIGSRSHSNSKTREWILNNFNSYTNVSSGSSLKFCKIAEGKADIYPRFGPTSEWDIAAGHIILKEAGGQLLTLDNKEILYNTKDNLINPEFIASNNLIKI